MDIFRSNLFKDKLKRLFSPGKSRFLRLASDSVADVNRQRDADWLIYARKAMIMT